MTKMRLEDHDLHGTGYEPCEVYDMTPDPDGHYWPAVADVPCPVDGCSQAIVWYEAGYVPGYRVCMLPVARDAMATHPAGYRQETLHHRFLAGGSTAAPTLVRDSLAEIEQNLEVGS